MQKTILVTGGAGFIGCNFLRYMLGKYDNYRIINLDLLTYAGRLENLEDLKGHPNYEFVLGDITDSSLLRDLFKRYSFNYVINFAAESHVDRSIKSPDIFVRTNILGTQVLLDASLNNGVYKFVQISTDEVYGSLGSEGLFSEVTPLAPNSPYSASKASADMLVRAYHETYGLPVNITRCSNNYGPYQFPEKLIPLIITNAMEHKPIPVYGDGLQIRDWLHVWDHCSAIDLVLHGGGCGEVYNIGGNNEKTNLEIVKTILAYLGKPLTLIEHVQDRLGHDRRYAIDAGKVRRLGWLPQYPFERGICETIDWYLKQEAWWRTVKSGERSKNYQKV